MASSDFTPLEIECSYSNIGEQWVAEARRPGETEWFAAAKGTSRPDALRNLADVLEEEPEAHMDLSGLTGARG
jgi:hypothetical protein